MTGYREPLPRTADVALPIGTCILCQSKLMAALLAEVSHPKYAGCIYGATTKMHFRTKAAQSKLKSIVVMGQGTVNHWTSWNPVPRLLWRTIRGVLPI
jgi:hypothetical protein